MLKRLRTQFVLITLALTGAVLIGVLGSTLWTTWTTQRDITTEALERGLDDDLDHMPMMGMHGDHPDAQDGGARENLLVLAVDVGERGVIIKSSRSPIAINTSVLAEVVSHALASDDDMGFMDELHIAWMRRIYDHDDDYDDDDLDEDYDYDDDDYDGIYARVSIVDTTAMDSAFRGQLKNSLLITAVAMVALLGISWALSSWALAPVAQAWEDQRRFVADASHELKTPLAVIVANTDILMADEGLSQESRRWVESTALEAGHMRALVNDLLELARTDEGRSSGVMRSDDVDLSDVVESAALEFDAIAFERGCLIESEVEPGLHVQGDAQWLERLAKILVDNACKYASVGSTITVRLAKVQGHATLTVNNQGNVIDPEDLAHIFDRFYRSDKARTRETGGFGLGLAIAKGIAEAHGGKILATSDETSGTTFTVTL